MSWMKWCNNWINMKVFDSLSIEHIGSAWAIIAHIRSDDVTIVDNMVLESNFESEEDAQNYLDSRMRDMF